MSLDRGETPVYLATQQPPSAQAQDEAVLVTITVAAPALPEQVGEIEIEMPLEFANHLIVQLREAVPRC